MSFNGSGSFLINTAGQPVVSGTVISSTAFNALTADLATGLSTCITKDGQTTVTANIPMSNYKFTGLGAGSAATDSANLSQVQSSVVKLLASVSGADTITAVGSPTVTAYAAGQMFYFIAAGDNTTTVTLNIDGLGAKAVTRDGSVALAAGDIKSGEVVVVVYDGTRFQVVSQLNSAGDARFANVSIASALNVGGVSTLTGGATIQGLTVGRGAGAVITNTALGAGVLSSNTTGSYNTAVGRLAMTNNTQGFNNTSVGVSSLESNLTGNHNSAFGYNAGLSVTSGVGNTFIGKDSGYAATGSYNTFVGPYSANSTGCGEAVTSGSKNTILGGFSGNQGGLDIRTASNYIVLSDGDGNPRQVIDGSGNLGIGTSSPSSKFDVAGTARVSNTTGNKILQIGQSTPSANDAASLEFQASSTQTNWAIRTNWNVSGALEFNPSSSAGGTSYTTPSMLLTSSGNLGLGVTPSAWGGGYTGLQVKNALSLWASSGTAAYYSNNVYYDGSSRKYVFSGTAAEYEQSGSGHAWKIAASGTAGNNISFTQAMTLDASGNLGVGTSTIGSDFRTLVYGGFLGIQNASTGTGNNNGLYIGYNSGSTVAQIYQTENDALTFSTNATERARITSGGDLLVGTTSISERIAAATSSGNCYVSSNRASKSTGQVAFRLGGGTSGVDWIIYQDTNSDTFRIFGNSNDRMTIDTSGNVTINGLGTGTVYSNAGVLTNTNPSDERLKDNVADLPYGLEQVLALRPVSYKWKNDYINQGTQYGFIAQEVKSVMPELVREFDTVENDEPVKRYGLEKDGIYAALVKAVQEQQAMIKSLEAKVAALEAK